MYRKRIKKLQEELGKLDILEFWRIMETNTDLLNNKFDCERWVDITSQEKTNLIYLDMFKHFKWFYDYQKKGLWQSFTNDPQFIDKSQ